MGTKHSLNAQELNSDRTQPTGKLATVLHLKAQQMDLGMTTAEEAVAKVAGAREPEALEKDDPNGVWAYFMRVGMNVLLSRLRKRRRREALHRAHAGEMAVIVVPPTDPQLEDDRPRILKHSTQAIFEELARLEAGPPEPDALLRRRFRLFRLRNEEHLAAKVLEELALKDFGIKRAQMYADLQVVHELLSVRLLERGDEDRDLRRALELCVPKGVLS